MTVAELIAFAPALGLWLTAGLVSGWVFAQWRASTEP
jgi:hypothetical protein